MMKRLAFAGLTFAAVAACAAEPETVPSADPALVERLALANTAEPDAPKLAKADRLVAAAARTDPDRLVTPAATLLTR
jgi:hypothetical protein